MGAIIVREEFPRRDSAVLIGEAARDRLHVASFNVRGPADPAPHSWAERRELVARLWRRERPTILSTQEAQLFQVRDLCDSLDGYRAVHLSRLGGGDDESTAIVYDARRLTVVDYAHRWLSDTPLVIGSASWGNTIPRMLTWVRFADAADGGEFVVVNTHLDHESVAAQERGAVMVRDLAAGFDVPAIVTGDFNVPHGGAVHKTLLSEGLRDAWDTADERLTPEHATFHAWEPEPRVGDRIDWILVSEGVSVASIGINAWAADGLTPSDHWPVQALLARG